MEMPFISELFKLNGIAVLREGPGSVACTPNFLALTIT
jgi:hypothetical protein